MDTNFLRKFFFEIIIESYKHSKKYNDCIVLQEVSGGHTNLYFNNFCIGEEYLSKDVKTIFESHYGDIKDNLISSANSIFMQYLIRTESTDPLRYSLLLDQLIFNEAANIVDSTDHEEFFIEATVLDELSKNFTVTSWERVTFDIYQMSLRAHTSGMNSSEYLSRMRHSSTFRRRIDIFEVPTKEGIIDEVEKFVLCLSLALKRPISLDDISVVPKFWKMTKKYPFFYERMYGYWYGSIADASSSKFLAQSGSGSFMQPEGQPELDRYDKWIAIINNSPGSIYPFALIMRGVWEVFASSKSPIYLSKRRCLSGVTDILHGMEGLTRKSSIAQDSESRQKFQRSWKKIVDTCPKYSPNTKSSKKLMERLYDLRNTLSHGGVDRVFEDLKKVKIAIGDRWNPGQYSVESCSFEIAQWVLYTLDGLILDEDLLREFYVNNNQQPLL